MKDKDIMNENVHDFRILRLRNSSEKTTGSRFF